MISRGKSDVLFKAALEHIPGGVNSPVRAFASVGGTPRFITSAKGCWLTDADMRALGVGLVPLRKLRAHLAPICARYGTNVQARPGEGHGGVSVKDFGAMGNANFFNDGNQKWYTDAEFTVEANDDTKMIQRAVDESQRDVSGVVRLKLYKGSVTVVGRQSKKSLYSEAHVTFEADMVYDQRDAQGFINLNALRLKLLQAAQKRFVG